MATRSELNFASFPFDLVHKIIDKTNYHRPCLRYAEFYFSGLDRMEDNQFGFLSPILMAIFHSDSRLLKAILDKHGYPVSFSMGITPIELCRHLRQHSCLDTICSFLVSKGLVKRVRFTKRDYQILLGAESGYCHAVVGRMLAPNRDVKFRNFAYLASGFRLDYHSNLLGFLVALQTENNTQSQSVLEEWWSKKFGQAKQKAKEKRLMKEVDVLSLPFAFDFAMGSQDSVDFLVNYSTSACDEFVGSEWKTLVDFKWARIKFFRFLISALYFVFIFLTIMVMVFKDTHPEYSYGLTTFIGFFLLLEILELISFALFDWKRYVLNLSNLLDWSIFGISLVFPITISLGVFVDAQPRLVLSLVVLTCTFYRGFSYLRIFDYFTSIVGIIKSVVGRRVMPSDHFALSVHPGLFVLPDRDAVHGGLLVRVDDSGDPNEAGVPLHHSRRIRHERIRQKL